MRFILFTKQDVINSHLLAWELDSYVETNIRNQATKENTKTMSVDWLDSAQLIKKYDQWAIHFVYKAWCDQKPLISVRA